METRAVQIVIIGAGFSGLGMVIALRKRGYSDFLLLEKSDEVGGTWRDNTYPGCACDIPSHAYSLSSAPNPHWTRTSATQAEILEYLRDTARRHDLYRHVYFGREAVQAYWDVDRCRWLITTRGGERFSAQFLVTGTGALHVPKIPRLNGIVEFGGATFHSATWKHDCDLRGKKVAVIGTGASAVQFIPRIVSQVDRLYVFQRTPPWVLPKFDPTIPGWVRKLFAYLPAVQRGYRYFLYWALETRAIGFGRLRLTRIKRWLATWNVRRSLRDPRLRKRLVPNYALGCKRILYSNEYYPALTAANVELVTDAVTSVDHNGITDQAGRHYDVDVIIFATGFQAGGSLGRLSIIRADGQSLLKTWATGGPKTYLGIASAGFPNLFFLLGPNTGLGHNSVVFMVEAQIRYIATLIERVTKSTSAAVSVRAEVQDRFYRRIRRRLAQTVWNRGGCRSWYLDRRGENHALWPGFSWSYWLRTRKPKQSDFLWTQRARDIRGTNP